VGPLATLSTDRFLLRPFAVADAPVVQRLAGDRAVADTTQNIPHPYPDGAAEAFIRSTHEQAARGSGTTFAVVRQADGELVGCIGIRVDAAHARGELGYWIGRPYWGQGYGTEAAAAVLAFAFGQLGLNRVYATALTRNPASARVMQKIGLRHEGTLRQHVVKWGVAEDVVVYGLVRADYPAGRDRSAP
jgi:ribosomal-protein-alanine N-acetyltransferase